MTVSDASQLCAAKRTDCVLVVDDEEGLSGIFTAKDLAFRVRAGILSKFLFRVAYRLCRAVGQRRGTRPAYHPRQRNYDERSDGHS
jgi:hypothetical protein